jgi:hypothetical protein
MQLCETARRRLVSRTTPEVTRTLCRTPCCERGAR